MDTNIAFLVYTLDLAGNPDRADVLRRHIFPLLILLHHQEQHILTHMLRSNLPVCENVLFEKEGNAGQYHHIVNRYCNHRCILLVLSALIQIEC